jgi:hypothetical protein
MTDEVPIRRPSRRLSFEDAVAIQRRILRREFLNRIAADYDVNPGRIAEIKKGELHSGSLDVALGKPKPGQQRLI